MSLGLRANIFFTDSTAPWALASDFQFHDHFRDGRTPWTSDQLVARPLPKYRTRQTQNKRIHIPNIHALCGVEPTIPASERAKTLHTLGRSATVTGSTKDYSQLIRNERPVQEGSEN
jgi:hypothetical protein